MADPDKTTVEIEWSSWRAKTQLQRNCRPSGDQYLFRLRYTPFKQMKGDKEYEPESDRNDIYP